MLLASTDLFSNGNGAMLIARCLESEEKGQMISKLYRYRKLFVSELMHRVHEKTTEGAGYLMFLVTK